MGMGAVPQLGDPYYYYMDPNPLKDLIKSFVWLKKSLPPQKKKYPTFPV